jgi:hypothetical protein
MTEALFDQYGHPVNILVDPDHPENLFDEYGRPIIVVKDATGLDLAAYNAIQVLKKRGVYMPALGAIGSNTKVGSGNGYATIYGYHVETGVTPNSSCIGYSAPAISLGKSYYQIDWDRALIMHLYLERVNSDAEAVAYLQLKQTTWPPLPVDIADVGLGIKIENLALYGESYGVSRDVVDLGTVLVSAESVELEIVHTPGVSIEWKINGDSVGTQEDPDHIPSGVQGMWLCPAIKNGATGGVDARIDFSHLSMWQSKS